MESSHIRWLIAGLFLAFLTIVVIRDLMARPSRSRRPSRPRGFRPPRADHDRKPVPGSSWKAGTRR